MNFRKNPGVLYSHNDSGGNATVHVMNSSGGYLGSNIRQINLSPYFLDPNLKTFPSIIYFLYLKGRFILGVLIPLTLKILRLDPLQMQPVIFCILVTLATISEIEEKFSSTNF